MDSRRYAIALDDDDTLSTDDYVPSAVRPVVAVQYHQASAAFAASEARHAADARATHTATHWQRIASAHYATARHLLGL